MDIPVWKQSPLMKFIIIFFLLWPQLTFLTKSYSTNIRISMQERKMSVSSPCLKSSCFWTIKYMIPSVFNVLPVFLLNQLLCVIEINDIGLGVRETGHLGLFQTTCRELFTRQSQYLNSSAAIQQPNDFEQKTLVSLNFQLCKLRLEIVALFPIYYGN